MGTRRGLAVWTFLQDIESYQEDAHGHVHRQSVDPGPAASCPLGRCANPWPRSLKAIRGLSLSGHQSLGLKLHLSHICEDPASQGHLHRHRGWGWGVGRGGETEGGVRTATHLFWGGDIVQDTTGDCLPALSSHCWDLHRLNPHRSQNPTILSCRTLCRERGGRSGDRTNLNASP